ncbi:hypothetical protein [Mucilaginibacter paludis]|uniref:Uncharacterized protein n=1 Tax=Mucilaginibacter paludis DSM 18603 TaxID=714943 RepID=H1Y601_9SPHI|nr:hypothetical protein [Mucilaginibacter paludis]EHQ30423.1 hypothetical protein Mucpa_6369 [Mucilaginibacter paludis DSM 18603]
MITFKEHESVVYTDAEGNMIDTFVVYDTDAKTGLTHINHMDMLVPLNQLQLHPKSLESNHVPVRDAFSFEILKKLKAKYTDHDVELKAKIITKPAMAIYSYSKAS